MDLVLVTFVLFTYANFRAGFLSLMKICCMLCRENSYGMRIAQPNNAGQSYEEKEVPQDKSHL